MATLVLDIETAGENWEDIDKQTQTILLERTKRRNPTGDSSEDLAKDELGLSPYTAQIIVIGVIDVETNKGAVYFQAPKKTIKPWEANGIKYQTMSEKSILEKFWELSERYNQFVTYNGRTFDLPFITIRSAINGIRPKKDLLRGRYLYQQAQGATHIDLYDQLTYYGSFRFESGGSLHMACRAFGISTPKEGALDGSYVSKFYNDKKYLEIVHYNARDLVATAQLFVRWQKLLAF